MPHHDLSMYRDADADSGRPPLLDNGPCDRPVCITAIVRKRRTVLEASRFLLQPATCVGVVGRNGAGKSSLLLALAGLLRGGNVSDWGQRGVPASTALVAQHPGFPARIQVRSIIRANSVTAEDLDRATPGFVDAALLNARSDRLSVGQRQRIATAIAMARSDPLVLLDEPYSSLDVPGRIALRQGIERRRTRQPEVTMVIAAHAPADLFGSCDSIVALVGGSATQVPSIELAGGGDLREFEQALAELLERGA